jgi:hypothetical protein
LFQFRNFIYDMSLKLKSEVKTGEFIGFHDLTTTSWSEDKIKIEESIIVTEYFNREVYVDCDDRGKIRIKTAPVRLDERSITIYSYVPNVKAVVNEYAPVEIGENYLMNKWMMNEPISVEEAKKLMSKDSMNDIDLSRWVYRSFTRKMMSLNMSIIRDKSEEEMLKLKVEEEKTPRILIDPDFEIDLEIDLELIDKIQSYYIEDVNYEEDFRDDIENSIDSSLINKVVDEMNFMSDNEIVKQPIRLKNESDVFQVHPFWDEYIRYLLKYSNNWSVEAMLNCQDVSEFNVLKVCGEFLKFARNL